MPEAYRYRPDRGGEKPNPAAAARGLGFSGLQSCSTHACFALTGKRRPAVVRPVSTAVNEGNDHIAPRVEMPNALGGSWEAKANI